MINFPLTSTSFLLPLNNNNNAAPLAPSGTTEPLATSGPVARSAPSRTQTISQTAKKIVWTNAHGHELETEISAFRAKYTRPVIAGDKNGILTALRPVTKYRFVCHFPFLETKKLLLIKLPDLTVDSEIKLIPDGDHFKIAIPDVNGSYKLRLINEKESWESQNPISIQEHPASVRESVTSASTGNQITETVSDEPTVSTQPTSDQNESHIICDFKAGNLSKKMPIWGSAGDLTIMDGIPSLKADKIYNIFIENDFSEEKQVLIIFDEIDRSVPSSPQIFGEIIVPRPALSSTQTPIFADEGAIVKFNIPPSRSTTLWMYVEVNGVKYQSKINLLPDSFEPAEQHPVSIDFSGENLSRPSTPQGTSISLDLDRTPRPSTPQSNYISLDLNRSPQPSTPLGNSVETNSPGTVRSPAAQKSPSSRFYANSNPNPETPPVSEDLGSSPIFPTPSLDYQRYKQERMKKLLSFESEDDKFKRPHPPIGPFLAPNDSKKQKN